MLRITLQCSRHPQYDGRTVQVEPCLACDDLHDVYGKSQEPGAERFAFDDGSEVVATMLPEPDVTSYMGPLSPEGQTVKGPVAVD